MWNCLKYTLLIHKPDLQAKLKLQQEFDQKKWCASVLVVEKLAKFRFLFLMENSKKKSRNFHFSTLEIRPLVPNISDKNRRLFLSLHGYISATKIKRAKCRDFSKLSKKKSRMGKNEHYF